MRASGRASSASRAWPRRSTTPGSSRSTRPVRSTGCCTSPCATSTAATSRSCCGARVRSSPPRAIELVGQLAEALDAAHARGLIHRDVKPSNALVAREGAREHVYLADFGLTKTSGPDSVTASGQLMGTVSYLAPEVIRGEQPDASADLYALGCVLFECLTGEVPFMGSNEAAVIYGHLETPPPSVRDRSPRLPVALDPVIARALAKDPAERCESGAAIAADARAALEAGPPGRSGRRARRPSRRAVLIGAAAVAVAGAVAVAVWPDRDTKIATIRADAVAVIDPGERSLRAQVALDGPPSAVAAAAGAIWVADDRNGSVSRIDPATHTVRQTVSVGHGQSVLAAGRDGVWAANRQDGTISLISAATQRRGRQVHRREPDRRLPARRRRLGRRRQRGRGPATRSGHPPRAPHRRRSQHVGAGVRRRRRVGSRRSRAVGTDQPGDELGPAHARPRRRSLGPRRRRRGAVGRESAHRHGVARRSRRAASSRRPCRSVRPTNRSRWPSAPAASGSPTAVRRR